MTFSTISRRRVPDSIIHMSGISVGWWQVARNGDWKPHFWDTADNNPSQKRDFSKQPEISWGSETHQGCPNTAERINRNWNYSGKTYIYANISVNTSPRWLPPISEAAVGFLLAAQRKQKNNYSILFWQSIYPGLCSFANSSRPRAIRNDATISQQNGRLKLWSKGHRQRDHLDRNRLQCRITGNYAKDTIEWWQVWTLLLDHDRSSRLWHITAKRTIMLLLFFSNPLVAHHTGHKSPWEKRTIRQQWPN